MSLPAHKNQFWRDLRHYLETIPPGAVIPHTDELKRFIRLQRFINKYLGPRDDDVFLARNQLLTLAEEFDLSWFRAARLYIKLRHLAGVHKMWRERESLQRSADFLDALSKLRHPLNTIGSFSKGALKHPPAPSLRIAETHLENAAWQWANDAFKNKDLSPEGWETAKSLGFKRTSYEDGSAINYDSVDVVRQWLRLNDLFSELVPKLIEEEHAHRAKSAAQATEAKSKTNKTAIVSLPEMGLSSTVTLIGITLPKIFENLTSRNFYVPRPNGKAEDKHGARFVGLALSVMGLRVVSPEVIREYSDQARRAIEGRLNP